MFRKLAEVATARETAVAGSSAHETATVVAAEAEADEAAALVVDEAAAPAADEKEAEADEAEAPVPDEAADRVALEGYFAVKIQATSIISLSSNLKAVLDPRYY